jgi:signal transduction histidine kinase
MYADDEHIDLNSVARFHVTKVQYLLFAISFIAVVILGYSSITGSSKTIDEASVLSNVESPAASIIFTQRETLVYATRLAQWSNGGTTRREVQIARNLLAQRLAVIDTSGRSMGSRASDEYWKVLRASDAIVAGSPSGILPEGLHKSVDTKVSPLVDEILRQSRDLVVAYQNSIDEENIARARDIADRDRTTLISFYIFIIFGGLFLLLNVRTNFKIYRRARVILNEEQIRLEKAIQDLSSAQNTVTELQELNLAKSGFISTVNHELRTPLTSIIGYIDLMREEQFGGSSPEAKHYLDVLDRNAQILLNLVESILSLSKIDAAQGKLAKERVSLHEVIDNSIFVMEPVLMAANIAISFTQDEDHFVEGDSGQLNQVMINLIGNAVKFSPKGSKIDIFLDSYEHISGLEYARIRVADHGIGIPAEDIDHLFTRFFRAKNAVAEQYPGTGLGLAIVHQALELHGGHIAVESELGKGTTFLIEIPHYMTPEERMILERRHDVLRRGILALNSATTETIKDIAHEIGGAIGFYGFVEEGQVILNYARAATIEDQARSDQLDADKKRMVLILNEALSRIGGEKIE